MSRVYNHIQSWLMCILSYVIKCLCVFISCSLTVPQAVVLWSTTPPLSTCVFLWAKPYPGRCRSECPSLTRQWLFLGSSFLMSPSNIGKMGQKFCFFRKLLQVVNHYIVIRFSRINENYRIIYISIY